MVHVPKRFGQEFEAAGREGVRQRHRARGVARGGAERHRGGQERAGLFGADADRGDDERDRQPAGDGKGERLHAPVETGHGKGEPSENRRGDVVRVSLQADRLAEDLLARVSPTDPVIREGQAGDDRRGARAQPARERNIRADREGDRRDRPAREPEQVAKRPEHLVVVRIDREIAAFPQAADREPGGNPRGRDLQGEPERQPEAVEPGPQVRSRCRRHGRPARRTDARPLPPSPAAGRGHSRMTLRKTSGSSSTFSTAFETETARSGSLRPCPVTVQTIVWSPLSRPCAPSFRTPATLAAEAGSTKIPSTSARALYAPRISSSVTISIRPPERSRASSAPFHEAGFPILIAVAIV